MGCVMNGKGFTLIEVITIIVLLSIVALITTVNVFNIIESSKIKSYKNSVLSVFRGTKLYEVNNNFWILMSMVLILVT